MKTVKLVIATLLLVAACYGCKSIVAGLTTAANEGAVVAEDMKESANPYVSLAGWLAFAVTTGAATLLAKIRNKANLEEREMTENERALFESLAATLVKAIEVTDANKVKKAVASATKHDDGLTMVLKDLLADASR